MKSVPEPLRRNRPGWKAARIVTSVLAVLIGLATAAFTAMVGSCDAFGGTCPSPESTIENDVVGGIAIGLTMAIGVPVLMLKPDRKGLIGVALLVVPVCTAIGFLTAQSLSR